MKRKKNKRSRVKRHPHFSKGTGGYQPKPIVLGGQSVWCGCKRSFYGALDVVTNWIATLTNTDLEKTWVSTVAKALRQELEAQWHSNSAFVIFSYGDYQWRISKVWYIQGAAFADTERGVQIRGANNIGEMRLRLYFATAATVEISKEDKA